MNRTQVGGDHYIKLGIQPFEYSHSNNLDARQHTAVKYITRYKDKNGLQDLRKAQNVIEQMIAEELKVDEYRMIDSLITQLVNKGKKYDSILVIGRGGLWAAAQIGYALDIKNIVGDHLDNTVNYGAMLFVDDICDSGKLIAQLNPDIDIAVMVARASQFKIDREREPTYVGGFINHEEYVTFSMSQPFDVPHGGKQCTA